MYITFHGAARQVTGSKHLIHLNDGTILLPDCGRKTRTTTMYQVLTVFKNLSIAAVI
ncbi:MAG TPA: hypothetical protein VGM63_23190 [Mucilaginibacter sp.]